MKASCATLHVRRGPILQEEAVRFATLDHDKRYPAFLLMLRTDSAPRLIGACGLGERNGEAELGYWIARPYWGLGFASEGGSGSH